MTANRLTLPAAVLIALALVPTLLHSYVDLKTVDGYTATAVGVTLAGLPSRPSDRTAGWVKRTLDSDDWSDRHYQKPDGRDVRLFVSRSYDLKRLYHHPELAVAYGHELHDAGTQPLEATPDGPVVRVLRGAGDQNRGLALYALLYNGDFVANPYTFQLRTAVELLFSPRRPMTLFFAYDEMAPATAAIEGTVVARVLAAAIRSFELQSPSRASQ